MKSTKYASKILKVLTFSAVLILFILPKAEASDLVAHWPFEETSGTSTADLSGNGNDGTINGPVSATGKIDLAFQFDGVDDYIEIPSSASLDAITTEITLMTWVKATLGARQTMFDRYLADSPGFRSFEFDINEDGTMNFALSANGTSATWLRSADSITRGEWTHVAATSNGTTMKIYINGVLDANTKTSPSSIFPTGKPIILGMWEFNADALEAPLTGIMDEAKIYDRALTAKEIREQYSTGSLVAHWPFEETSGTSTADLSGNGNDGTINGPVSATGKIDLAFLFDGVDDYIEIPSSASLDAITTEITLMTWVKATLGARQTMFDRYLADSPGFRSFEFDINEDGTMNFALSANGTSATWLKSADSITRGEWTHVAATSDGTTMKIYINGVLDANTKTSPSSIFPTGKPIILGMWEFNADALEAPLTGIMDEAKIYDRALTAKEIREQYSTGSLVAHWPFEETSGTSTADLSGNGNDGTINGPVSATGKIDLAFQFDGVDDYIEIPSSASLDAITTEITLMTWVKATLGARQTMFDRYLADSPGFRSFEFDINEDGTMNFALSANGTSATWLKSADTITGGEWTHVAATSDGSTMKIYINGVLDANTKTSPSSIFPTGKPIILGMWEFNADALEAPLTGIMDEAKIYDRALNSEEIMADYDNGALIGFWPMDETSGTTAYDLSVYENNGTINGPVSVSGKLAKAFQFDGVDDYIVIPSSASLDAITTEITLLTWVKATLGARQTMFDRYLADSPGFRSFEFDINEDGTMNFALSGNGTSATWLKSADTITGGEWTHVAATSDGSTMKIYINGVLDPNTKTSPSSIFPTGKPINFGTWEFNAGALEGYLTGIMDETKIYSRALSAEEITADYLKTELAGAISGNVTDKITNLPVEGVTVSDGTRSGDTDANGNYTIENVPVATYTVTAATAGYRPLSVEDVAVSAYQAATVDFLLVDSADYVAFWPFEETDQDTITYDLSENHNDGMLFGLKSVAGKIDSAFLFDGIDDYIAIPSSASLDSITTEITLMTWVRAKLGARQTMFDRYLADSPGFRSFEFDINEDGTMNFALSSDGQGATWLTSANMIPDSIWTHVAATSDGSTMKIYVNGVLDPNTKTSPSSIFPTGKPINLGTWEFNAGALEGYLTGIMDEAKIFGRALSAEEISYDYAMTEPTGTISGTVTDDNTGDPIQGVTVSDGTRSKDTDADGNYTLENVPVDSTYIVTASKFGYSTISVDSVVVAENSTSTVDFSLVLKIGSISGTVTDAATGNPIEGAAVSIGISSDTTDADGNYIMEGLPTAYYTVSASASGYKPSSVDSVEVITLDTTIADIQLKELTDLMAFWAFEEISGTSAVDSSIYSNDGVIYGPTSTSGMIGLAFEFDGTNDYITVPQSQWLDSITGEITVLLWVKTSADTKQTILEKWSVITNDRSYMLEVEDGKVNFGLCGDGTLSDEVWLTSSGSVTSDTWTHVAATSDGSTMKLYINSVLDANTATSPSSVYPADADIHIGRLLSVAGMWKNPFNGIMDEVKIYNRALTEQEITEEYDRAPVGINNLVFEDGLLQAYPNPFSSSTTIRYKTAIAGKVTISIYNLSGQKIQTLVNETQQADSYSVVWERTNARGGFVGSGIYYCTLSIDNKPIATKKLMLLK